MVNNTSWWLLAGLGLLAGVGGFVVRRATMDAHSVETSTPARQAQQPVAQRTPPREPEKQGDMESGRFAFMGSTDTLDDLVNLGDEVPYERLARWLMDAEADEIAGFWEHYRDIDDGRRDINDLIMISWTRRDPGGATAAVAGTGDEHYAWWAWAASDPRAALDAALATNKNQLGNVAWGIGEFHPQWMREHFDDLPPGNRGSAFGGLAKWGETDDPIATLEFLMENGQSLPAEMLGPLVREDPIAAHEWILENSAKLKSLNSWGDQPLDTFYRVLGDTHPDILERLAEQEPSGAGRRKMEQIVFSSLMNEDLDAAYRQAEETRAPAVATERMAQVGLRWLHNDPERAFEVAESLFAAHPNALGQRTRVRFPDGGSTSSGGGSQLPQELIEGLVAADPARTMGLFMESGDEAADAATRAKLRVAGAWVERDFEGFAQWVVDHDQPEVRKEHAHLIVGRLENQQRFEEAIEWSASLAEEGYYNLWGILYSWNRADPGQARQWLDTSDLPAEQKERYREDLKPRE